MADSGSVVSSKKPSSFFQNISENNNSDSAEWQPVEIQADMGAAQNEGEFGEYKKRLVPQVPNKEQKVTGVQLMHSQRRLYEDFNTEESLDVS
jgi:hypothetical protein